MERVDFEVRNFVFRHFVQYAQPPTLIEAALTFKISPSQMSEIFQRLHQNHFFFLELGTTRIRMANPLSAVPTQFRVQTPSGSYWANCAWDMLGIPAMLHRDASIEASCIGSQQPANLIVRDEQLDHDDEIVHFAIPVHQWYDDLIHT